MAVNKKAKKKVQATFKVRGEHVLDKIKELIKAGKTRRIVIKNKTGKTLAEFPLAVGVIGAVAIPVLAAVGTIAALVTECTITAQREENK